MPHAAIKTPRGTTSHHLYYERTGDGEPLLLIRGLGRSARFWAETAEGFSRHFEVITFDNRGIGRSESPSGLYRTPTLADDCAGLLDVLGVDTAHVFGMSLGGMIAQEVALRHGHKVRKLVLGCTTPGGKLAHKPPRSVTAEVVRASLRPPREKNRRTADVILSSGFAEANPAILAQWAQWFAQEPTRTRDLLRQVMAATTHDALDRLHQVKAPTLVLTGDADRLIPPENSTLIASRIPGATLTFLKGAGHDFTTERPAESVQIVSRFLRA